jgi:rod shape determining protein RodA
MRRPDFRDIDWLLMLAVFAAVGMGIIFIWSASHNPDGTVSMRTPLKQFVWAAVGFVVFLITTRIDYNIFRRYGFGIFFGNVILLGLLFTPLGAEVNNSRAWIRLGGFSLQPSEFMKLSLAIGMSRYLMREKNLHSAPHLIVPILILAIPIGLILKQPDLGTAITLLPIFCSIMFVAGVSRKHLFMSFFAFIALALTMWFGNIMTAYQKRRIFAFLNPDEYRVDEAYQLIQSKIAIGSGGFWGMGVGEGYQNRFGYLPTVTKNNDFIFAVIAEESGFLGILFLTVLFLVIGLAIASTAIKTREPFAQLFCMGIFGWIMGQFFINCGVALGLLPTTGVPLVFVSAGGSSLIALFAALGIVTNIRINKKAYIHSTQ